MIQMSLRLEPALRQREPPTCEELGLKEGTDCYFLYKLFLNRHWWNIIAIFQARSHTMVNWAARTRISNLNTKLKPFDWIIESRIGDNRQGEYRLTEARQ